VIRAAALELILLAGCAAPSESAGEQLSGIRVIAVLPFADHTGGATFDADEFANILASELVKVGGVRVVRPAQIRAAFEAGEALHTADDAIRIGRRVRADAVLACAITDYDPYDPPKVAVAAQVLRTAAGPISTRELDQLLQSASWRRGALTMSRERAGHALAAFEEVYDAQEKQTRMALQGYARGQIGSESAFPREREFLAVQSRYMKFVSWQVICRALELLRAHGS
jgi:hypothetical protein